MSDLKLKDVKNQYITTGRLNQNVIGKEIAISWYKCKLQNIKTNDLIKLSKHEVNNPFSTAFLSYIDSIISDFFQYALSNTNLQVCKSRIHDTNISSMNSIDDLLIGTNGGYNAFKNQKVQVVSKDEHYLDVFTKYITIGIPIIVDEKSKGTLMILSEQMPSEYEISSIKEKLVRFYNKENFSVTLNSHSEITQTTTSLESLLIYPKEYWVSFNNQIDNLVKSLLPRMITGSEGCGKTTLAWYLGLKSGLPYYIDMKLLHPILQHDVLLNALSHNDTVIVENIEFCVKECIVLLTVYTDKKIDVSRRSESSKYKCSNLYLTTAYNMQMYNQFNDSHKYLNTLIEKLKISTLHMLNLDDFKEQYDEIIGTKFSQNHIDIESAKDKFDKQFASFKALERYFLNVETDIIQIDEQLISLEEHEKTHILNVYKRMNGNATLTSEVLGIGRSTLYRKLEKYQNETK